MRKLLIGALLTLAVAGPALGFGLGREGRGFGKLGSMSNGGSGAAPSCSNKLDFTQACNLRLVFFQTL